MCIIVAKKKGLELPSKEILFNCFDYNPHGAGFMYNDDKGVHVEKGFMDFTEFYTRVVELDLKNQDLVMHFRISTAGNVDGGNSHPYPISTNDEELRNLKYSTDVAMVHNGIVPGYTPATGILNDTQMFIKNYVSKMYQTNKDFLSCEFNIAALQQEAQSKLCFLNAAGITTVGSFIEDEGIIYSNSTYKVYDWATEFNDELMYIEGCPLSANEFYNLLDQVYLPSDEIIVDIDGVEHINDGNYCIDSYENIYKIDYSNMMFKYVNELPITGGADLWN